MLDLLLDMSSRMEAMEEFVAQHNFPCLTVNQSLIPESSSHHHDGAATSSRSWVAAGHLESSWTITPRDVYGYIPETVRKKLARCLRQALPLVESLTDNSDMDEEPDQRKKRQKALKSVKVRTADSAVVKIITWPH